jgi:hypothetical protein
MSSPRPWTTRPEDLPATFAAVRAPGLHLTGTRDDSPLNDTRAAERRVPFDHCRGVDSLLVIFAEGDHQVFDGGRRLFGGGPRDPAIQALIRRATLAFWDAYLRDDPGSARWLWEGGLAEAMEEGDVLETRRGER